MLCLVLTVAAASAIDLSAFAKLPQDPPPEEITLGKHYWVSNEERPELFRADLEGSASGGVFIGVGGEQSYIFAGWSRPDVLILMDFDGAIPEMHEIYASVFKRAQSKEEWVDAIKLEKEKQLKAWLAEDIDDKAKLARIYGIIKEARSILRVHAERIGKGFVERRVPTFLNDDDQYRFVRALFVEGRVFRVRGDLTGPSTMQAIGDAAKRSGLPVRTLYMSNAEQYFGYGDRFRRNILALPFDEKALVLRTISWARFGFAPNSNAYHYGVQSGLSFQSWVADAKTKGVSTVLEAATRKNGFSRLTSPPGVVEAPVPPKPLEPPPIVPCLEAKVPAMGCVPGGPFLRGSNTGEKANQPQSTVWVQTFYMDEYEVTYAEYKACEKEKKCHHAGPNYEDFNAPKQPITGVSWFDSKQYCEAHGKRLATEAEWEKAARGTDGRTYPWGEEPATCERTVIMTEAGRSCGKKQNSKGHEATGRPEPVGTMPPTQYGLYDMAGNSWEWVNDWFTLSWDLCGDDCAGVNPRGPCGGSETCPGHSYRVVRGGSWFWPAEYATTFHRRPHIPSNNPLFHHFGFRCAADVDAAKRISAGAAAGQ